MPRELIVTGTFMRRTEPVEGFIRFTPSRLWVIEKGVAYACLAPLIRLQAGCFVARLTPTNSDAVMWHYKVETPAGTVLTYAPWDEAGYTLRGLVDEHHLGERSPYGR